MYDVFSYSLKSCKSCVFSIVFRGFTVPTLKFNPWQLKNAPGHLLQDGFTLAEFVGSSTGGYGKKPIREQHMISRPDISKKTFCEISLKKPSHLFFLGGSFWLSWWCCLPLAILGQLPLQQKWWKILGVYYIIHGQPFVWGASIPNLRDLSSFGTRFTPPKKICPKNQLGPSDKERGVNTTLFFANGFFKRSPSPHQWLDIPADS